MSFRFKQKIKAFKKMKGSLPRQVGNIAKNHYLKAFRDQGFTDDRLNPWKRRKRPSSSDRRNRGRRAILVNRGHLRRSIRVGAASFDRVEVGSYGIKYAKFHNKGEGKLPERKFVGASKVMNEQIRRKIRREIKNILK